MILKYSIKTAAKGVSRNKSRSALTILGIVIGITSIMMVMSLGKGAQDLILNQIQSIGSRMIIIHPGRKPEGPSSAAQMMSDSLKQKDLDALRNKSNVPHASDIEPLNVGGGIAANGNQTYQLSIFGSSGIIQSMYDMKLSQGRFLDDEDVKNKSYVVVIGSKVKQELFGNDEALNQKIKLKGISFKVVGILAQKGQGFINFDEAAVVPYSTAQQYIFGIKHFHHVLINADSENSVADTIRDVTVTLRNSHDITDPKKDDFYVVTQQGAMDQVSTIMNILTLFLAAVAAISLVVGGVGIMNIMLVSVTERTREIGLRKALGATSNDIMFQFLIEAVMLTGLGGLIGILLGAGLSYTTAVLLSNFAGLNWVFEFPILAAILGIMVSGIIGLIFGIYPAYQASKKSPIEALRYE